MPASNPPIKVVPGQIWADKDPRGYGRRVRIIEVDKTRATVAAVTTGPKPGRRTRVLYDEYGLRGYTLVSELKVDATLAGSVVIEPAAGRDDLDRVPVTSYVQVNRDGTAIVPTDVPPLSTESVAREVRALIEALPSFEFDGVLVRTAGSKYGSARSRISVTDSIVRF